jgi:uncharacterized protein with PIN domain
VFTVELLIHGSLCDFLPAGAPECRRVRTTARSVKDLAEAQGVPHPEIGRLTVNDRDVGFDHPVAAGERVAVFPFAGPVDVTAVAVLGRAPLPALRFVADVHLGRLVRHLRLLGLDCRYAPPWADAALAEVSARERRIMLTRDRGLLKRSCIEYGIYLRSDQPLAQAREVMGRVDVKRYLAPFTRCSRCNGPLAPVAKATVAARLPEGTRRSYDAFYECQSCRQLYWAGAHFGRLQGLLEELLS